MFTVPKISVIIPVYNRQHLLSYTLDSIIEQSFTDWECILVDDHSSDASFEVMEEYQKKDVRFKAFRRPNELKKGANACRNFGFTKSTAQLIKWFDSDDIMLCNHLEIACQVLTEMKLDFVVTDTVNFDHDTNALLDKPYSFDRTKESITAENLAQIRIGWITDDFLGKREIVNSIKFNENIVDGDEYNFFIKVLQNEVKGDYVNQILTHRRMHNESISFINKQNDIEYQSIVANIKYQTANDLVVYDNKVLIRWFLAGYMRISFDLAIARVKPPYEKEAFKLISKYHSVSKAIAFFIAVFLGNHFKKGYNIMKYART
ncbi:glycosyltransferase involved in cell wall biosynthesis [Flavobacterium sp. CG_23.5]|uniref:glycosyltransferase family 2 protein n=1 Tax=Flavobacterium sp. CG_23.5 TaxID=2760708 RepID=UPI001AE9141C|nr:glycosyltransferase family 2 protein [Flavobacterium sp. CG_23.5]MBP2283044.1 glycosyltransferase involved in cell wall biosynthesis [Flavobacterium sp. CG_23.5]